jgi:hypothetical protein
MKLTDDMCLTWVNADRPVWQMAIYTAHLACGQSVSCRAIKSGTMVKHLLDIAKLVMRASPRDPRKRNQLAKGLAPEIQDILDEVKRWEDIPNRREPFTIEMRQYLVQLLESHPHIHGPDSALAAICDFCGMGIYDGFRLSEWAQPTAHSELNKPQLNRRGDPMAFCLGDVRFLTPDKVRVPTEEVITMNVKDPKVGRDFVTCRTQKNGHDGEERQHTRNTEAITQPCHITCLMSVVQRFDRLVGDRLDVPLCVYREKGGRIRYITDSIIVYWFRIAAAYVYKLDPVKDHEHLSKWSAHSLRVGATVILHGMGFTDTQIQFLLRWRSNAFYTYLRNIASLAAQQNKAITDVMPHFI